MHGDTNGTLGGATDVVTVPSNTLRDIGVNAEERTSELNVKGSAKAAKDSPANGKESPDVLNNRLVRRDQHHETDDSNDIERYHVDATFL